MNEGRIKSDAIGSRWEGIIYGIFKDVSVYKDGGMPFICFMKNSYF